MNLSQLSRPRSLCPSKYILSILEAFQCIVQRLSNTYHGTSRRGRLQQPQHGRSPLIENQSFHCTRFLDLWDACTSSPFTCPTLVLAAMSLWNRALVRSFQDQMVIVFNRHLIMLVRATTATDCNVDLRQRHSSLRCKTFFTVSYRLQPGHVRKSKHRKGLRIT